MRLENIEATAIKGRTFSHQLGEMNLIHGPNDAGKTARTDAVRLLLLGYLPELGATNPKTFALASASKMEVAGQLAGGLAIRRTWTKSGKSVKATSTPADLPETPLVMLNAADYFGRSDAGRVNMLFEVLRLDPKEWSRDTLRERIKTPEVASLSDIDAILAKDAETVQAWLELLLETVAEAIRTANAEVDRFTQMAQGLATLSGAETPLDPDRVAADIRDARAKLEELTRTHGELTALGTQERQTAERRALLGRQCAELKAELGDRTLPDADQAEITKELRELESERAALWARHQDAVAAANERAKRRKRAEELAVLIENADREAATMAGLETTLHRIQDELQEIGPDTTAGAQLDVTRATEARAAVLAKRQSVEAKLKAARERHDRLIEASACPTCGTAGMDLAELVKAQYEATEQECNGELAGLDHQFAEAGGELDEANKRLNAALERQRRRQALERQAGETTAKVARASHAASMAEAYRRELDEIGDTSGTPPVMPDRLEVLAHQIANLSDDLSRLAIAEKLAARQDEMEALGETGESSAERAAHVSDEIEVMRERLEELAQLEKRVAAQAGEAKRLVEAQEAREKQEARAKTLKLLQKVIAEVRADMIAKTFGPILERVNVFTRGILPTPLEYREGELGRFQGMNWIPVRTFGGAYTAVTYAGIQAALGTTGPAKIVIVDELGRFDPKNKRRFFENVKAAIEAGLLEQFIGVDVSADDYKGIKAGLTRIDASAE